ncbi:hypothetical protein HOY82DRAFT_535237 [Tuber indicum]|nr:hypothetical protein HOY82DRAFT_535237 [Tuber indicum]
MSVVCNSHYSDRGELSSIPIHAKGSSAILSLTSSTGRVHLNRSHIPVNPWRLPKKRLRPISPILPVSTKIYARPVHLASTSVVATSFLMNTSLPDLVSNTQPGINMEFPFWIKDLASEKMAKLISGKALQHWEKQNPGILADENICYEYNFLSERLIIKCMPTAIHDSVGLYLAGNVSHSLNERFSWPRVTTMVCIGSGTRFTGDENGFSEKLLDGYVKAVDQLFTTVVHESGFTESIKDLKQDARLWLLHTGGATRVVIVVCMNEIITTQVVSGDTEERHTSDVEKMSGDGQVLGIHNVQDSSVEETADNGQALGIHDSLGSSAEETAGDELALGIEDPEGTDEEARVLNCIDETTQLNSLAMELLELNRRAKWKRPLLGGLEATIHLYRAAEDNKDIIEVFTSRLLPQPPPDSPEPKEFSIPLHDIIGTKVLESEPSEEIVFALEILR